VFGRNLGPLIVRLFAAGVLKLPDLAEPAAAGIRGPTIVGSVLDRIVRIEVTEAEVRVRTGTKSLNFVKLAGPGEYGGAQSMKLLGEAQQAPPTPAFALAMVGAFI